MDDREPLPTRLNDMFGNVIADKGHVREVAATTFSARERLWNQ